MTNNCSIKEETKQMQRKNYNGTFKAKVALELCKGQKTVNQVSTEFNVHPTMITKWKREMLKNLPEIFSNGKKEKDKQMSNEKLVSILYEKIGELEVELDWLKKKSNILN